MYSYLTNYEKIKFKRVLRRIRLFSSISSHIFCRSALFFSLMTPLLFFKLNFVLYITCIYASEIYNKYNHVIW